MEWFRFYADALHNPKVLRLTDAEHRLWVNLLCMASEAEPRGILPPVEDIAVVLRMRAKTVEKLIVSLLNARLLEQIPGDKESFRYKLYAWDERQPAWDDAAKRMAASRKRRREEEMRPTDPPPDTSKPAGVLRNSYGLELDSDSDTDLSQSARESAAQQKPEKPQPKSAPTLVADDPTPVEADGPIGTNTAKQVRETIWAAGELWPMRDNLVGVMVRQWLAEHPAKRVQAAMNTAKANGSNKPEAYIRSLLADPTFPREAKPPGRPAPPPQRELKTWVPPVLDESMFDLTPEQEAALARRDAMAREKSA